MKAKDTSNVYRISTTSSAFGPETTHVTFKNSGSCPLEVKVQLTGLHDFFRISDKQRKLILAPGATATIPVTFLAGNPYRIMNIRATYKTRLVLLDCKSIQPICSIPIVATGPGYVPAHARPCYNAASTPRQSVPGIRRPPGPLDDPPPSITRTVYRHGTSFVANMGEIDHDWHISHIEAPGDWVEICYGEAEGGDGIPSYSSWGTHFSHPEALDYVENSSTHTPAHTYDSILSAGNPDGVIRDSERLFRKLSLGHHHACMPDDFLLDRAEVSYIRDCLDDIETWLRADTLVNMGRYVEYWNTNIASDPNAAGCNDLSFDERGCLFYGGSPIADETYLTARVGEGGLADHLLAAMEEVIIYTQASQLPRTYRPDEHFESSNSRLCEAPGITYGSDSRSAGTFGEWIAVCRESDASDMTIIHELFHYASAENYKLEDPAYLLSYLYIATRYGWAPDGWPPFS
jgi:hypothetical protein